MPASAGGAGREQGAPGFAARGYGFPARTVACDRAVALFSIEMLVHIQDQIIMHVFDGTQFKPQLEGVMYQVDEKPETIHLYVVREGKPARPSLAPILLSLFGLALPIALSVVTPYKQPVTRLALRVQAVPPGIKSFTYSVAILPTGIRTNQATTAHGVLTISNGSIIAQVIPAGFIIGGVITNTTVYVPAGSIDRHGHSTVSAHALVSGHAGRLPSLAFNAVIGRACMFAT